MIGDVTVERLLGAFLTFPTIRIINMLDQMFVVAAYGLSTNTLLGDEFNVFVLIFRWQNE